MKLIGATLTAALGACVLQAADRAHEQGARAEELARISAHGTPAEMTKALDAAGPDASKVRFGRDAALTHAAVVNHDHPEMIDLLVELGAPIDAQDADGRTPLHHAIDADDAEATRRFLSLGADLTLENSAGLTPPAFCRLAMKSLPDHESCRLVIEAARGRGG